MRKDLMHILACPVCKSPMELTATEEKDGDVVSGSLFCRECNHAYPINDSIPNLPPLNLQN